MLPVPSTQPVSTNVSDIYRRLLNAYGPQYWWSSDSKFEIIAGAILTQSTSWNNADRSVRNLKSIGLLSYSALCNASEHEIARAIRPSGFFRRKTKIIMGFVAHISEVHQGSLTSLLRSDPVKLRQELLSIFGIGPETADNILVYVAKFPSFIIDAYTKRILKRLALDEEAYSYSDWQQVFHKGLKKNTALFNEYHALLVKHGKSSCKKIPQCIGCCLLEVCPSGLSRVG